VATESLWKRSLPFPNVAEGRGASTLMLKWAKGENCSDKDQWWGDYRNLLPSNKSYDMTPLLITS